VIRKSIEVEGLHHGGAPIPQASVIGNLLASGGISPLDPQTGLVPDEAEAQVELVFANLRRVVEAAGGTPDDVIKCTAHVRDKEIRPLIDQQWTAMFPDASSRPARRIDTADLLGGLHIQLEILAVLGDGR
jgi:2-iminobutanoate/2-iminopropanoate deaminase